MKFMQLDFEIERVKDKQAESLGFKSYKATVKRNGKTIFQPILTHTDISSAKRMGVRFFLRYLYDGKINIMKGV